MAIEKLRDLKDCFLSELQPLLFHLMIIAIFTQNGYNMIHFYYITPAILILMFAKYLCFWKPKYNCRDPFYVINFIILLVSVGMFFGIFIGLFGQILTYPLSEVADCYVSGQLTTSIPGIEMYSILYVNYEKDGQTYLGYGCISGQSNGSAGLLPLLPSQFYKFGDQYGCREQYLDPSYYSRLLQKQSHNRITKYFNVEGKRQVNEDLGCLEKWSFSEVKLPSWMCLPVDTTYEELIKPKKCYISHYGIASQSENNSKNRQNLKYIDDFVLVGFKDLLIPLDQYIIFLIFCYCPFIVSLDIISVPIYLELSNFIKRYKSMLYATKYVPYFDRNFKKWDEEQDQIMLNQQSPIIQSDKENNNQQSEEYILKISSPNQVQEIKYQDVLENKSDSKKMEQINQPKIHPIQMRQQNQKIELKDIKNISFEQDQHNQYQSDNNQNPEINYQGDVDIFQNIE